jgi:hypothetical protein
MVNDAIAEVVEHFKIRQVLERYCRAIDRRDRSLLESVYWPEATDDHGIFRGPAAEFIEVVFVGLAQFESTLHVIAQSNIECSDNLAVADTYFIAGHRTVKQSGVGFLTGWGRYVDKLEKRRAEWRILERVCVIEHFAQETDIANGPMPIEVFKRGKLDRSDLSYAGRAV